MFGMGSLDNSWKSFINLVFGFEFKSKIVPFGVNYFLECVSVFTVILTLSQINLSTQEHFRNYFILNMTLCLLSCSSLFFFKFKKIKS